MAGGSASCPHQRSLRLRARRLWLAIGPASKTARNLLAEPSLNSSPLSGLPDARRRATALKEHHSSAGRSVSWANAQRWRHRRRERLVANEARAALPRSPKRGAARPRPALHQRKQLHPRPRTRRRQLLCTFAHRCWRAPRRAKTTSTPWALRPRPRHSQCGSRQRPRGPQTPPQVRSARGGNSSHSSGTRSRECGQLPRSARCDSPGSASCDRPNWQRAPITCTSAAIKLCLAQPLYHRTCDPVPS